MLRRNVLRIRTQLITKTRLNIISTEVRECQHRLMCAQLDTMCAHVGYRICMKTIVVRNTEQVTTAKHL